MSLSTVIVLNAVLDLAVIGGLTRVMRVPFRLDRVTGNRNTVTNATFRSHDLCRAA